MDNPIAMARKKGCEKINRKISRQSTSSLGGKEENINLEHIYICVYVENYDLSTATFHIWTSITFNRANSLH